MESKLVISCRMMHNLIKIYRMVQTLWAFILTDHGRTDECSGGQTRTAIKVHTGGSFDNV